ncbi:MAG: HAD-IB family hydrolase [Prolixibacteraceae bacterium]|jgi:HAD superfamily hydrolase (TIGR01490 family)|nr:HAD-IB family hydrolase [Prolixibacteraceae bacterium]
MTNERKHIAFFDIDKTILKINSGEALVKQAYRRNFLNTIGFIKAIIAAIQYKFALKDTHHIIRRMGSWLNGVSEEKLDKLTKDIFYDDIIPNIRPHIIDEIKRLKSDGTKVVILSSAIKWVCQPLGKHLNVDDVICTELEVVNGTLTGNPVGNYCFRSEKLNRLKAFCENMNYELQHAAYYADSIDDLPALEKVGHPVCVTPDKKLTRVAQSRGWTIQKW